MIKKIREIYRKYDEWENQEVYINVGYGVIKTNNITLLVFTLILSVLIFYIITPK